MSNDLIDEDNLRRKIESLQLEHRDLDAIIHRLAEDPFVDQLQLRRMKQRKLQIKDMIEMLRARLIPDLDA